ncbi:MAG: hypothetical protein ACE5IH_08155, partial [Thermodesulfobacteriota bacterium]
ISTSNKFLKRGHFYFGLTFKNYSLTLDFVPDYNPARWGSWDEPLKEDEDTKKRRGYGTWQEEKIGW